MSEEPDCNPGDSKQNNAAYSWVIAVVIAIAGSTISNVGVNLQKLALLKKQRGSTKRVYFSMWMLGFFGIFFGAIADFAALAFGAQSVVAPLGSTGLVANVFLAPCILKEKVSLGDVLSTLLILSGCVLAVSFASHKNCHYTLKQLFGLYETADFAVYATIVVVVIAGTLVFIKWMERRRRRYGVQSRKYQKVMKFHRFSYAFISGVAGAQSVLFAKTTVELITDSFRGGGFFLAKWQTYLILFGMASTVTLQVYWLNCGLARWDALYNVPVFQSFWILVSVIGGGVFYAEFHDFDLTQSLLFPAGVLLVIAGVYFLSQRKSASEAKTEVDGTKPLLDVVQEDLSSLTNIYVKEVDASFRETFLGIVLRLVRVRLTDTRDYAKSRVTLAWMVADTLHASPAVDVTVRSKELKCLPPATVESLPSSPSRYGTEIEGSDSEPENLKARWPWQSVSANRIDSISRDPLSPMSTFDAGEEGKGVGLPDMEADLVSDVTVSGSSRQPSTVVPDDKGKPEHPSMFKKEVKPGDILMEINRESCFDRWTSYTDAIRRLTLAPRPVLMTFRHTDAISSDVHGLMDETGHALHVSVDKFELEDKIDPLLRQEVKGSSQKPTTSRVTFDTSDTSDADSLSGPISSGDNLAGLTSGTYLQSPDGNRHRSTSFGASPPSRYQSDGEAPLPRPRASTSVQRRRARSAGATDDVFLAAVSRSDAEALHAALGKIGVRLRVDERLVKGVQETDAPDPSTPVDAELLVDEDASSASTRLGTAHNSLFNAPMLGDPFMGLVHVGALHGPFAIDKQGATTRSHPLVRLMDRLFPVNRNRLAILDRLLDVFGRDRPETKVSDSGSEAEEVKQPDEHSNLKNKMVRILTLGWAPKRRNSTQRLKGSRRSSSTAGETLSRNPDAHGFELRRRSEEDSSLLHPPMSASAPTMGVTAPPSAEEHDL